MNHLLGSEPSLSSNTVHMVLADSQTALELAPTTLTPLQKVFHEAHRPFDLGLSNVIRRPMPSVRCLS